MRQRRLTTGDKGWAGLFLYVLIIDSWAWYNCKVRKKGDETMTAAFGSWLMHPRSRWVTGAAWAGITLHLFWDIIFVKNCEERGAKDSI